MITYIINEPTTCPYCGHKTERLINADGEDSVNLICTNQNCIGIKKAHLNFVIGKSCFDIKDFGEATANLLFDKNVINNWYDIFTLNTNDLIDKLDFTQYSAEKLIYNIQNVKHVATAEDILYSIGIRTIGRLKAKKIVDVLGSLDDIKLQNDVLIRLTDLIGPESTKHFTDAVYNDNFINIIDFFKDNNFNLSVNKIEIEILSNSLNGLKVLATGTFDNYSRDEIKNVIEQHGGKYASGVNKTLDLLICGKNVGPAKLEKAKKLNIKMISEDEFIKMIS